MAKSVLRLHLGHKPLVFTLQRLVHLERHVLLELIPILIDLYPQQCRSTVTP